ncbi:hypothetical protein KAU33_14855 [Candidatus Dependentiae bacterium]|nr:hypothetical protein [Candidatus Dependentiae bacterium]
MRKVLLLTLVLISALFIFTGCDNAVNPMEVSNQSSESMSKASEDGTFALNMEIVNENSNGNLVFKFYHDGLGFIVNSITINSIESEIVNYNFIEPRAISHIVVNPLDALTLSEELNIEVDTTINGFAVILAATATVDATTTTTWDINPNNFLYGIPIYQSGKTLGGSR